MAEAEKKNREVSGAPCGNGDTSLPGRDQAIEVPAATKEKNGLAIVLKLLAVLAYALGIIAGIAMASKARGDEKVIQMVVYCAVGLFGGTVLLSFSEIVRLLSEINRKMK